MAMPFPSTHNEIAVAACLEQPWNLLPQVRGHLSSLGLQPSALSPTTGETRNCQDPFLAPPSL